MNRREAIKTAGAALAAPLLPPRLGYATDRLRSGGQAPAFRLSMRGASLLRFPANGSWATLKFISVTGTHDPIPVHLPWLTIGNDVKCVTPGHEARTKWLVAGHEIEPAMGVGWSTPTGYDAEPDYSTSKIWKPSNNDWSSLIWIPKMDLAVNSTKETAGTSALVKMTSGKLQADEPNHAGARKYLWIWATPSEWLRYEPSLGTAPQTAMTDQLVLTGTHSGRAEIKVTSVATGGSLTLSFEPRIAGQPINISLVAEPLHGQQPTRPMSLYSGYYNLETPVREPMDRKAPYLSPLDMDGIVHAVAEGGGAMPTPRPLCGAFRTIE